MGNNNQTIAFQSDDKVIMYCRDCDYKTRSAADFVDHVHKCKVNPVVYSRSADDSHDSQ